MFLVVQTNSRLEYYSVIVTLSNVRFSPHTSTSVKNDEVLTVVSGLKCLPQGINKISKRSVIC